MILKGKFNTAKIFTDNVEQACIEQIENLLNMEAFAVQKSALCQIVMQEKVVL